jgi:hypothetical protein
VFYILFIADDDTKKKFEYEKDHARWTQEMIKWQNSFYCQRCNGIFEPGDNNIKAAHHFQSGTQGLV